MTYYIKTNKWITERKGTFRRKYLQFYLAYFPISNICALIIGKVSPFKTKIEARIRLKRYLLRLEKNNRKLYNSVKNCRFIIERSIR